MDEGQEVRLEVSFDDYWQNLVGKSASDELVGSASTEPADDLAIGCFSRNDT